jgi:dynein heavy chain
LFQLQIHNEFTYDDWYEFLRDLMHDIGVKEKKRLFLIVDNQIFDERALEDINNLLNIGEVPNLYPFEDADMIQMEIKQIIKKKKSKEPIDPESLWAKFVNNVKKYLHLAICMTPIGDEFRLRIRNFPALVNCCSVMWVLPWGSESLNAVAQHFLNKDIFTFD